MSPDAAMWQPFDEGRTIGSRGSEAGVIVRDDEHVEGARITLERDGHTPYAITCGIYGWMLHTRFFGEEAEARRAYDAMKAVLDEIIRAIPLESDPDGDAKMDATCEQIAAFVERFP